MKRKLIAIVVMMVLFTVSVSASNTFELTQVDYPIYANGNLVAPDALPTLSYQNRTYVPLRKLSEASGLSVYFDDEKQTISIYNSPLNNMRVYAAVANAYENAIVTSDCIGDYIDGVSSCVGCVIDKDSYVSYYLESLPEYINDFLPLHIATLKESIGIVISANNIAGGILGEEVINDLYLRLYYAQEAQKTANRIYEVLYGYVTGVYTSTYFRDIYYGADKNGYAYLLLDQQNYIRDSALINFDKYMNMALGL